MLTAGAVRARLDIDDDADSRARCRRHPRLPALWMLLNWRLQQRLGRDLLKPGRSRSGRHLPLPFLRRHTFSAIYNGRSKPDKSRNRICIEAAPTLLIYDKNHSVGAGVDGPIMAVIVIWP